MESFNCGAHDRSGQLGPISDRNTSGHHRPDEQSAARRGGPAAGSSKGPDVAGANVGVELRHTAGRQ